MKKKEKSLSFYFGFRIEYNQLIILLIFIIFLPYIYKVVGASSANDVV